MANQTFSLGPNKTELEIALEEYQGAFGDTSGGRLLARATEADDAYKKKKFSEEEKARRLQETIAWARREGEIDETELERLIGVVATVSESSYENGFVLAAVLRAAATGYADINLRLHAALVCGQAAAAFSQAEAARNAYADAVESLRLLRRFYNVEGFFKIDADLLTERERHIIHAWETAHAGGLLDLPEHDPATVLLEHVIWNTDFGEHDRGLLVQSDAFARVVIRLEHWVEVQGGDPEELASAWGKAIDDRISVPGLDPEGYPFARARCAAVCAEALLETGYAAPAIALYDQTLRHFPSEDHPLHTHARINQAFSLHQAGRANEARQVFSAIDGAKLQELAEIILTVRAEWARYLMVARLLGVPLPKGDSPPENPRQIVEDIAGMLVGSSNGRTGYLRNLFIGQLHRDIEAIRALLA